MEFHKSIQQSPNGFEIVRALLMEKGMKKRANQAAVFGA